ncbi:MAG TPA: cysteine hydrolase [Acidimicrobiales bacterium]|jgi:nicotinamidase-related amidase|nr:cysteine hydrolase [Acidimicrobiales bacterium]
MPTTALLLMDLQTNIIDRFPGDAGYLDRINGAADAARSAGITVLWIKVGFREGMPEVSSRNKAFSALAGGGGFTESDPAFDLHPDLRRADRDVVVVKKRVSAFTGSDLEVLLRAAEVESLVLAGIATSGVVLSTLRQAADLDYRLTVLADGCLDADDEVHRVLTDKVFPRQAEVTTVGEWTAALR